MKPGLELDALVAEKVMGIDQVKITELWKKETALSPGFNTMQIHIAEYSTSIEAAWEVVEKLKSHANFVEFQIRSNVDMEKYQVLGEGYSVCFCLGYGMSWKFADSVPLAICLAALKAVGHEWNEVEK